MVGDLAIAQRSDCAQGSDFGLAAAGSPQLAAFPCTFSVESECPDIERERPAFFFRDLAEPAHRGARDAERDGAVEPIEAALRHAIAVVEIRGHRIEAFGGGSIAAAA